jgi:hypothetical protein
MILVDMMNVCIVLYEWQYDIYVLQFLSYNVRKQDSVFIFLNIFNSNIMHLLSYKISLTPTQYMTSRLSVPSWIGGKNQNVNNMAPI